ncbi:MAG: hypothetical protein E4H01_02815 [Lysobacterales bacterium]|nr:MAG: hypothetical protein E4H01_02815 [Xanthomonadales bacterium]
MAGFMQFMGQNSSQILSGTSAALDFYNSYQQSKIVKAQGQLNETLGLLEADSLRRKATMTENIGVHQAQVEQYKGRVAHSDATAQMAAGGGVVDPEMLAKIKMRADYNALSAIYDARSTAISMREQAGMRGIEARFGRSQAQAQARDIRTSALTTALTEWPRSVAQSPTLPKKRSAGYDYASQSKAQGRGGY